MIIDTLIEFWHFDSPNMTAGTFITSMCAAILLGAGIMFMVINYGL